MRAGTLTAGDPQYEPADVAVEAKIVLGCRGSVGRLGEVWNRPFSAAAVDDQLNDVVVEEKIVSQFDRAARVVESEAEAELGGVEENTFGDGDHFDGLVEIRIRHFEKLAAGLAAGAVESACITARHDRLSLIPPVSGAENSGGGKGLNVCILERGRLLWKGFRAKTCALRRCECFRPRFMFRFAP